MKVSLENAELLQLLIFRQGAEREASQNRQQVGLHLLGAAAGQGQQGGQRRLRLLLGQRSRLPVGHELALHGDAGGVAQVAVVAVEVRPGGVQRLGVLLAVEGFQRMPQLPLLRPDLVVQVGRRRRFASAIRDPIQARLRAAAAGGEVQGAVVADHHVGQGHRRFRLAFQRFRSDEVLEFRRIARPLGRQVSGDEPAVGPVAHEERLLVLGRELGPGPEGHAGRRADADVDDGPEAVGVVFRPLAGAVSPAELGGAGAVVDTSRPIPGPAPIPLHVGVEGEQLAVAVEGEVVGVAEAAEHEVPLLAVRVGAEDEAAGGEAAGRETVSVGLPRQQQIFLVVVVRRIRSHALGDVAEIALQDIEVLVRPEGDGVRPVLTAAGELLEQLHLVELTGLLRVLAAVQAVTAGAGAVDVEAVEGVEQAHRLADGQIELFDLIDLAVLEGDAQDRLLVLAGDDKAALVVLGHVDPRAFGGRVGGVEQLDLKARQRLQRLGRRGGRRLLRLGGGGKRPATTRPVNARNPIRNMNDLPCRSAVGDAPGTPKIWTSEIPILR